MTRCSLPQTLHYVCKFGCIYRDQTLRHIACKRIQHCVAPCQMKKECLCFPPPPPPPARKLPPFYSAWATISRTQSLHTQYRQPTCKGHTVCARQ